MRRASPWALYTVLLPHQRADAVHVLVLVAGLVAPVQHAHLARAVNDNGARHAADVVELTHLAVFIEEDRKTHRRLLEPVDGGFGIRFNIHADEREAELAVLLIYAVKQGHLLAARATPARPEVKHHDLPQIG